MNSNLMALCSEKVKKALNQVSGGLCYFTAEAKHAQLLDVQKTLSEIEDALASPKAATQPTPPAAPVGELVERLRTSVRKLPGVYLLDDECQVAIREVAAWLDLKGYNRAANDLRQEAGK